MASSDGPTGPAPALRRSFIVRTAAFSELLGPVWRAGTISGGLLLFVGIAMVGLTRGVVAVICWPLGTLLLIVGACVLHGTICARRAVKQLDAMQRSQEPVLVYSAHDLVDSGQDRSSTKPE